MFPTGHTAAERHQLAGLAVMLTLTAPYLPDEVLTHLVQGIGGPRAFVEAILALEFTDPEPLQGTLLAEVQEVLSRLRRSARGQEPQAAEVASPSDLPT